MTLRERFVRASVATLVPLARLRQRFDLRRRGRNLLRPAQLSLGIAGEHVLLRMTPHGGDGTTGDLFQALSGVDAERLARELRSLAKKAGRRG